MQSVLGAALQNVLRAAGPFEYAEIGDLALKEIAAEMHAQLCERPCAAEHDIGARPVEPGIVPREARRQPVMSALEIA